MYTKVPVWTILLGALAAYLLLGFRGLLPFLGFVLVCFYLSHNANAFSWVVNNTNIYIYADCKLTVFTRFFFFLLFYYLC